ncbi:MAG TPA: hypothetical protein VGK32_03715 [Vicinamibacterales bacterium]|jgi:hypothetical protein
MVPPTAVVVWQLRGFVEDIHCFFSERGAAFTLVIERAGERLLTEEYTELRALLARAADLRGRLVGVGFAPIGKAKAEPEPVLQSLLMHFVLEGRAATYATIPAH